MLDANRIEDIKEISRYGKAKGYLIAKRYKLPVYSNFFIIEDESEVQRLLDTYTDQNDFCMRSDTKVGNVSIGIKGKNGNRESIFDYMREIKQKEKQLGVKGVAIVYWNAKKFCPTYEAEGAFYLDFRTKRDLIIDYIGKGWDGTYLSHGSACHETYVIPWEDILFLDENNRIKYRKKVVSESEYNDLRKERIKNLTEPNKDKSTDKIIIPKEVAERAIPYKYNGIKNDHFRQVVNQVIIPMYDSKQLQRYYKEYIPIAQIENGKALVPEIILPERLKFKETRKVDDGR